MEELIEKKDKALKELITLCIQLGSDWGVDKFLHSAEFEEEAMVYCEESGWMHLD